MKTRIKLGIFPISLTIILLVSLLITILISKTIILKHVGRHLQTTAHSRAHNIETLLNDDKVIVQVLAGGIPFTNVLDPQIDYIERMAACNLRIKRTIEIDPDISRIRVLNKNGIVISSSHEDIGFDLSKETIFIKGNKDVYIGEVYKSEYTGNFVFSVSAPIYLRDTFSGVLIINFDLETKLYEILTNRTGLGKTGKIFLLDNKGYLLSPIGSGDFKILETKINSEQLNIYFAEHLEKGLPVKIEERPTEYLCYNGKKVLGTHYYISGEQWCLIAEIDTEEVYKPLIKQIILLITIFSVLLIAILIYTFKISRDITLPIRKLHKRTEEIIKGNLDYKIGIKSKDEIGQLSRAFDIMTTRLAESHKEIQKNTEELEVKVKDRTAELEKQFIKSEKQRSAALVLLNDLNETTRNLKSEIYERKNVENELKEKMSVLERFNRLTVDRELKMIELKREINELLEKAGMEKKYSTK